MIKSLLLSAALLSTAAFGQTTLFSDDFEAGASNWTLNGGTGNNQWGVNAQYTGYDGLVEDTPDQPAGTTGGVNSNYMHIYVPDYCQALDICNAGFESSYTSNRQSTLTNALVTTAMNTVTVSFIYLCDGSAGNSYGVLEYSLDNGTSWTLAETYADVNTWTAESISMPAWDNQASLKFRFRWQNNAQGEDPAFAVDEVEITALSGSPVTSISTGTISPSSWCFQSQASVTIPFTVTGTVNSGNIYTAQLSDASGSFASPVSIGTLTSSASGSLSISGNIPGGTAVGAGYRIRVVASNPATTGTDNGSNLSVNALPPVTVNSATICMGMMATLTANGAATYTWAPPTGLSATTGQTVTANPLATTTYTVTGTSQQGCSSTATSVVTVQPCTGIDENAENAIVLYPNPATTFVTLSNSNATEVTIYSVNGQKLQTIKVENGTFSIGDLAGGTYFVGTEDSKELLRLTKL